MGLRHIEPFEKVFQNAMNNCIDKCKNFFGNNVLIHQMFTVSIVSNI